MSFFRVILCVGIMLGNIHAVFAADCPLHHAVYKPSLAADQKIGFTSKRTLDFTMTVEKFSKSEWTSGPYRNIAFIITAYDAKTKQKLSMMRLSNVCSNGTVVCRLSSVAGQVLTDSKQGTNFKSYVDFDIVALDKDMHKVYYKQKIAPYIYIFPNTGSKLHHESRLSHGYKDDFIKRYVTYYTDDNVYPDFGGADVWKLYSCQS